MSDNNEQNQSVVNEGQPMPKMQKIIPMTNIEKGQPVPSMQQKPQTPLPSQNQDSGNSETKE